ncbi:hypothetical protein DL771_003641 [Monosporascus sp. 5C6A]|nr:hypothetical protein DL771_003641 [Monosporascus sp. 5C6A]
MATKPIVNPIPMPTTSQESRNPLVGLGDSDSRRDSGYFTQSRTPARNSNSQQSSRSSSNAVDRSANQVRPVLCGTGPAQSLTQFDKHVDNDTISRFSHIQSQIEKPLLKYVCKFPGKYRSMAIRLMVLGTSESEAKPYIVVLAPEDQCKRVRKFFDKSSVRALCQPGDETMPSFEVLVYGRPPELKEGDDNIDVLVPLINGNLGFTSDTYCGAPIIVRQPSGVEKRATFGGVIKAVSENGDFKLYGLTAGHVVGDTDDDLSIQSATDTVAHSDDLSISDSDSDSDTDGSVEEVQGAVEYFELSDEPENALEFQDDSSASWSSLELGNLGNISKESPLVSPSDGKDSTWISGENFDWALIEMTNYKPNRLRPRSRTRDESSHAVASTSGDLVMPPPLSDYIGFKKSVVVIAGSEGPKRGHISALPSRLLLHPGREFVNSLVVNLEDNKRIVDGDSGSWVVNERTLQVYGHVVATDAFGGGYIMPLDETFRDIKNRLSVASVELASMVDIASVMMLKMADAIFDRSTASPLLPNLALGETTSVTKTDSFRGRAPQSPPMAPSPLVAAEHEQRHRRERDRRSYYGDEPELPDTSRDDLAFADPLVLERGYYDDPSIPRNDHAEPRQSPRIAQRHMRFYDGQRLDSDDYRALRHRTGSLDRLQDRESLWEESGYYGGPQGRDISISRRRGRVVEMDFSPPPRRNASRPRTPVEVCDSGYVSARSSARSSAEPWAWGSAGIYDPPTAPADAYACDSGYGTSRGSGILSAIRSAMRSGRNSKDITSAYRESSVRIHDDRKDRDITVYIHKSRGYDEHAPSSHYEGPRDDMKEESRTYR